MKARDIIKSILEHKSVTNAEMAHRLGITQAALWDRLNTKKVKDIPTSTLNEMLRVLDYKILIVPANRRVREDEYEVSSSDTKKVDKQALLDMLGTESSVAKEGKIKLADVGPDGNLREG